MAEGYSLGQPVGVHLSTQTVVVGTNPGANTNFTLVHDGRWIYRMVSAVFSLTTDANAANRYVTVEKQDGGGRTYSASAAAVVVTANTTAQRYCGSINRGTSEWNTGSDILFPLDPVFIVPGDVVKIIVANIQAGDTLTKIAFVFDLFPTGDADRPGLSD